MSARISYNGSSGTADSIGMEKAVTAASLPRRSRQCIGGAALMTMVISQCQSVACVYHVTLATGQLSQFSVVARICAACRTRG